MGALLDKWRSAKKLFKDTAKVKKPSPKVDTFASKGLGIEKALIKLEAAKDKNINGNAKALADWKKAALEYYNARVNYILVLDTTVGREPAGGDREAYRKGVVVLRTQLNAINTTITALTKTAESAQAGQNAVQVAGNNLMHTIAAACDGADAFIARVKANPTPDEFNKGIETAARDITQSIGNINKLTAAGFVFTRVQPKKLFTLLSAWGNLGREVADNAAPAAVLAELKMFENAVTGVKTWAA